MKDAGKIMKHWPLRSSATDHCSRMAKSRNRANFLANQFVLRSSIAMSYIGLRHMATQPLDRELKKGSAELLILSLVESRPRHGYEIGKLIEERSQGTLRFQVASLYPLLYRLEARGWIQGRWVEKTGQRRRRFYRLTPAGRKVLALQRRGWQQFAEAIRRITGIEYA